MDEATLEKEALAILRSFSEDDLRNEIIIPLFQHEGWEVEVLDRKGEINHGCDLLLKAQFQGECILVGVQLKATENISTHAYVKENIRKLAERGVNYRFGHDQKGRLTTFRWITTGTISEMGQQSRHRELDLPEELAGKVDVWDIKILYQKLLDSGVMRKIGALQIVDAMLRMEEHRKRGEGIFAAYYWHRVGRWYLMHGDPAAAKEPFDQAAILVKSDSQKTQYYYRTLIRYSEMWGQLAGRWGELASQSDDHLVDIAQSSRAKGILTERYPASLIPLLQDAESIFQQLEILQELQFVRYASLELLHVTRLLLRAGYPLSLPGMGGTFWVH